MGRLAVLLSFVRVVRNGAKASDVKFNPGGGANVTGEHFAPAGDDSQPLPDDYLAAMPIAGAGREVVVGYLDPEAEQTAQPGDKRIYARDEDGNEVAQVWLKNDGTVRASNDNGSVELSPDGSTKTTTPACTFDAKADGSIKGDNGAGSFELDAAGNFIVNGFIIDPLGNATAPAGTTITAPTVAAGSSLTVVGKEMGGHTHSQPNDNDGDVEAETNGPT